MPGKLNSLQGVATNLIKDFGAASTLRTVTKTFSAATGTTTSTTSDTTVYATPPVPFVEKRADGTVIRSSDLATMVQGKGLSPKTGDRLIYNGGTNYEVVAVRPQSAGSVIAFYELRLRA